MIKGDTHRFLHTIREDGVLRDISGYTITIANAWLTGALNGGVPENIAPSQESYGLGATIIRESALTRVGQFYVYFPMNAYTGGVGPDEQFDIPILATYVTMQDAEANPTVRTARYLTAYRYKPPSNCCLLYTSPSPRD